MNNGWDSRILLEVIANAEPLPAALVCLTSDLRIVCSLSAWIFHLMWLCSSGDRMRTEGSSGWQQWQGMKHRRENDWDRNKPSAAYLCLPFFHLEQIWFLSSVLSLSCTDFERSLHYRTWIVFIFSGVLAGVYIYLVLMHTLGLSNSTRHGV